MGVKAHAIGVLPPGELSVEFAIASPFWSDFMRGVADICDKRGAGLLIVSGEAHHKR